MPVVVSIETECCLFDNLSKTEKGFTHRITHSNVKLKNCFRLRYIEGEFRIQVPVSLPFYH